MAVKKKTAPTKGASYPSGGVQVHISPAILATFNNKDLKNVVCKAARNAHGDLVINLTIIKSKGDTNPPQPVPPPKPPK